MVCIVHTYVIEISQEKKCVFTIFHNTLNISKQTGVLLTFWMR